MKATKVRSHSRSTKGKKNTTVRSHARTVKKGSWKHKVLLSMKDTGMDKALKSQPKLTGPNPVSGTIGKTKIKLLRAVVARNSPSISRSHDVNGKRIGKRGTKK